MYHSFVTTVSRLKICDFSGEMFKGFEVIQFSKSATMTTAFGNCVVPVKSASAKFISVPITQKCQILCCDTLVPNERSCSIKSFYVLYFSSGYGKLQRQHLH